MTQVSLQLMLLSKKARQQLVDKRERLSKQRELQMLAKEYRRKRRDSVGEMLSYSKQHSRRKRLKMLGMTIVIGQMWRKISHTFS